MNGAGNDDDDDDDYVDDGRLEVNGMQKAKSSIGASAGTVKVNM